MISTLRALVPRRVRSVLGDDAWTPSPLEWLDEQTRTVAPIHGIEDVARYAKLGEQLAGGDDR